MSRPTFQRAWSTIDRSPNPAFYVEFMDNFHADGDDNPRDYPRHLAALEPQPGQQLLDVGCGTGGLTRVLARLVGPTGQVTGVDNSTTMIAIAEQRAIGSELSLAYQVADGHQLPFDDGTFDSCISGGVFEILDDPAQVLAEMVRVTRSSGRIVVNAEDAGTQAIDGADRGITRRILDYHRDHEINGGMGHQLYGLFREAELTNLSVTTGTVVDLTYSAVMRDWLGGIAANAQMAGAIGAAELAAWLEQLAAADQAQHFFSAITFYTVCGQKP